MLFSGEGRNLGSKLPTQIFNTDFGHFILKRYQTEHTFKMLLIKWKSLCTSWGPLQTSSQVTGLMHGTVAGSCYDTH